MDDFGVGHSSLSRLSDLPVDRLKVDQSLVHRMTLDRKSAAIMRLIVSLGAELDMQVIAEGVETEEQLQMLTDLGCPQVQGYLLGKPMSPERAQAALSTVWGDRSAPTPARVANHVRESRGIDCGVPLSGGGIAAARGAVATQRVRRDALFQHGLANSGAGRA
jgi:predicted signal transduction protein with EAL and GGDEF domain